MESGDKIYERVDLIVIVIVIVVVVIVVFDWQKHDALLDSTVWIAGAKIYGDLRGDISGINAAMTLNECVNFRAESIAPGQSTRDQYINPGWQSARFQVSRYIGRAIRTGDESSSVKYGIAWSTEVREATRICDTDPGIIPNNPPHGIGGVWIQTTDRETRMHRLLLSNEGSCAWLWNRTAGKIMKV